MDIVKSAAVWFIAICFLVVLFPIVFMIWLLVLPFDRERRITHRLLIWQSVIISRLMPVWTISIEGRKKAARNTTYVIISNHQSVLDILLINCLRYDFRWISKIENMKVPVLGWYLRMAGYITVDRGNDESKAEMLERSFNCLSKGISLMIFPEGTRSVNGEPGFFKMLQLKTIGQRRIRKRMPLIGRVSELKFFNHRFGEFTLMEIGQPY